MTQPTSTDEGQARPFVLIALAAFVVAIPFARPTLFHVGASGVQAADLVLPVVWVAAATAALRGSVRVRFDALFFAPVVYIATQFLSLVVADRLGGTALVKLAAYAEMLLLPWLMSHFVTDGARFRFLLASFAVAAVCAAAIGLFGFVIFYVSRPVGHAFMCGWGGIRAGNVPRLCAPFNNPNLFLNFLTTACPLVIAHQAAPLNTARGSSALAPWALLCVLGFVAMFTFSAGIGGFAISGALGLLAWRAWLEKARGWPDRGLVGAAAFVATLALGTMVATVQPPHEGHVRLVGNHELKLFDGMRPSIWRGIRVGENPATGVGYGEPPALTADPRSFTPPDKLKFVVYPVKPQAMDAHNVVLSVLGQSGVIGLAAFLVMLAVVTRGVLWRSATSRAPSALLWTRCVAASVFGALFFHGLVGSFEEARHLWVALGLGVAASRLTTDSEPGEHMRSSTRSGAPTGVVASPTRVTIE